MREDGGPAFPVEDFYANGETHTGMTLRDYFAAKALVLLSTDLVSSTDETAVIAYQIADAMLKERAK